MDNKLTTVWIITMWVVCIKSGEGKVFGMYSIVKPNEGEWENSNSLMWKGRSISEKSAIIRNEIVVGIGGNLQG